MFKRVLIANRGEIAVRVARTCRDMGISPVAIFSEPDRAALHVRHADRAVCVGPAEPRLSYLDVEKVIAAAKEMEADAIHPGYGFLSENGVFAQRCAEEGIVFVGPPASAMRDMGDKVTARQRMEAAGVPVVPGADGGPDGFTSSEQVLEAAREVGFPVMLKATAGGGGKGMRLVHDEADLIAAYEASSREALAAFGNGDVYVEKAIINPRHVEVQVLADADGKAFHFYERDCSVQRRHQKVIEETPCPVLDDALRDEMGQVAVRAAEAVDYRGAGTVEFLFDPAARKFYFLEMNTRLQVEHPITEWCCGVDFVRLQLMVAAGLPINLEQDKIRPRGASIECRVYAEDPVRFLPSPGPVNALDVPSGPGVRDDPGCYAGAEISMHYDPLISKLSVWGADREEAVGRMRRALDEYRVAGIQTNLAFHRAVLRHPAFISGEYDTGFIQAYADDLQPATGDTTAVVLATAVVEASQKVASTAQSGDVAAGSDRWRHGLRARR